MIENGIARIWRDNLNLKQEVERLAQAVRLFMQIEHPYTSTKNKTNLREVLKNEEACVV